MSVCVREALFYFVSMGFKQDFACNSVLILVTFPPHSSVSVVVICQDVHKLVTQQGIFQNAIPELENVNRDFYTSSHQILIANNLYLTGIVCYHLYAGSVSSPSDFSLLITNLFNLHFKTFM